MQNLLAHARKKGSTVLWRDEIMKINVAYRNLKERQHLMSLSIRLRDSSNSVLKVSIGCFQLCVIRNCQN